VSPHSARTLAQAKINLALRVLGKESDGYHAIETVFLRIDLGDDVRVDTNSRKRTLRCEVMRDVPKEKNLAFRAAELFSSETGWPDGFAIEIEKRIPIGGGLGGGSADAAAVLRILNRLSPRPCTSEKIQTLAGVLGADVPFLASDSVMALGWGHGEKLTPLTPLPSTDIQLIIPSFGISTAEAYAEIDRRRNDSDYRAPIFTVEMFRSWHDAALNSVNDFEEVVHEQFRAAGLEPLLLQGTASKGGSLARMTGSGSTIFVVQNTVALSRDRANIPRSSRNTPALRLARVSLDTKVITTRTSTSVVPVELLD
jgi:4-diphosphocytidyl-2-C-methyl-D-erythritol kinase